ncbi:PREDICTED: uncharacterized protein LOC109147637 [Ipomoea nil]|uniref:uncharacterized protein LOC109147637 n=1 Tax=Ipomoea nil TaxID=35883 RepID=UPI00090147F7|nr:PREDICTED: uncharacterized protein LOC109147637 [Ipomoea nil]
MPRSKRFTDMSRSMSHQQSSSPTHEQLLNDAPLEEQTQDNETPQEQAQDSETRQDQNESSSKKKTRTAWEVDVINEEGFVRKKKLKVKEVWTLPLGEKIIVPFDNFDTPSTDATGLEIELGHNVNHSELWIDTHKVKRGSSVNEECRIITEKIRNEMEKGSSSQSQCISQDDPLGKTLGKEHNGRVRGLGFGPCPSKVFNNTLRMNDKDYVSTLEKELAATKAQLQVQSDKLQVQSDMQKAMGGALVAILERTFWQSS